MKSRKISAGQVVHAIGGETARIEYQGKLGVHVGEVDHLDGSSYVKLKKTDQNATTDHWFPINWIVHLEQDVVYVDKTPEEFRAGLVDVKPDHDALRTSA